MRRTPLFVTAAGAALVLLLIIVVRGGAVPLGVRGEWEWLRVPFGPQPIDVALAAVAVLAYAAAAGFGLRSFAGGAGPVTRGFWLLGLTVAAVVVQGMVQTGAPVGYGLAKWVVATHQRGSSGYFSVAKTEAQDPCRFLADYPEWVRRQDALHIGTHPPGLIAAEAFLLRAFRDAPAACRAVEDLAPESVRMTLRIYAQDNPMTPPERATLVVTGAITLLACAATVLPVYWLTRASLPPTAAWAAAAAWPLAPSAVMFQPASDTAFPLLSAGALALAGWSARTSGARSTALGVGAGILLGVGMQFSLVFLAVGLVTGLLVVVPLWRRPWDAARRVVAVGLGFLGLTGVVWALTTANPLVTWWWNQQNHARFYAEFPRTYRAWVPVNAVELAVGLGLPTTVWLLAGFRRPRSVPAVAWSVLGVLALLTLGGRNLSEVARLWIPFMPGLLPASGAASQRLGAGPWTLAAWVTLLGLQCLALQALIQVVYPI